MIRQLLLGATLCTLAASAAAQFVPEEPVENFSLSTFNEETGWKAWTLRGGEGRYISADEIHIVDMQLEVLTGESDLRVTTRITSPFAVMRLDENRAYGEGEIRLDGERFSLEGKNWSWSGESREVTIGEDARVTFQQNLDYLIR